MAATLAAAGGGQSGASASQHSGGSGWRTWLCGPPCHRRPERSRGHERQELAGAGEFFLPGAISQQAIVTNPDEAGGHDME